MENGGIIHLTSSELGNLWMSYMNETMTNCVLDYFLATVEDQEIKPIIESAFDQTKKRIQQIRDIFTQEKVPIPFGFSEQDVNRNATRLYSDTFFLHYVNVYGMMGIGVYGRCLGMAAREDVRRFFTECVTTMTEQYNSSTDLLLSKGLYVRQPYISTPKRTDFVKKNSYLGGFFTEPRALNAIEVGTLWANILTNTLGKALVMGFSQVAKSQEVREYLVRGKNMAKKHMKICSTTLIEQDIPSPITWDSDVKDSTVAPFSDKLMLNHTIGLIAAGLGNYGISISTSQRRDLTAAYARLLTEVGQYAEDGAKLMIENGWMEEPPQTEDRDQLAGV